jgi:hypothetical protein
MCKHIAGSVPSWSCSQVFESARIVLREWRHAHVRPIGTAAMWSLIACLEVCRTIEYGALFPNHWDHSCGRSSRSHTSLEYDVSATKWAPSLLSRRRTSSPVASMYSKSVRSITNLKAVWQRVTSVRTCSASSPVNRPCSLQIKSPPDSCISTRSTMRPLNPNLHVACQRSCCELIDPARDSR